jgi:hypothetical protein
MTGISGMTARCKTDTIHQHEGGTMKFSLEIDRNDGDGGNQTASATIVVRDESGTVRADVMVKIYEGVPRLVITSGIEERDSDDVTNIIHLLTGEQLPA